MKSNQAGTYIPIYTGRRPNSYIFGFDSSKEYSLQGTVSEMPKALPAFRCICNLVRAMQNAESDNVQKSCAAAFFNENFVNAALDMEKGDGAKLASDWKIQAYPTLLILDAKGKLIRKAEGFIEADELIRFGRLTLDQKGK